MPPKVTHNGRVSESKVPTLSRETLEMCDWLIDGITLAANHPDFAGQARLISQAKAEVAAALTALGGTPLAVQREQ